MCKMSKQTVETKTTATTIPAKSAVKSIGKPLPKSSSLPADTASNKLAVVRVRGNVGIDYRIKSTLSMLNLHNQHFCSVYSPTPSILGMLKKVKDYVTWGEIDSETFTLLIDKRATKQGTKDNVQNKFYRLNCPLRGFGRKGIKKPFSTGGALGYRGEKINELIKRMI